MSSAGTSSTAGSAGSGSGGTGGGSGGSSGGGTGGDAPAQLECSPGAVARLEDPKSLITPCQLYDPTYIAADDSQKLYVYAIAVDTEPLDESMQAVSVQFKSGKHPKMELWTSNAKCGQGAQQVRVVQAGPGGVCMQDYLNARPYYVLALYEDEPIEHVTVCARGLCP
jgi:hypothetical protein